MGAPTRDAHSLSGSATHPSDGAHHFSGLKTVSADHDPTVGTVDFGSHTLQIGHPAFLGPDVRMAQLETSPGLLSTYFAYL